LNSAAPFYIKEVKIPIPDQFQIPDLKRKQLLKCKNITKMTHLKSFQNGN